MTVGVIISTYNNPKWLEKTLWGYMYQTCPADEIIIADDGSRDETRNLVESFKEYLPVSHVWHEDNGFRKTIILNKALVEAISDYLIFTDQDMIPREDFIEQNVKNARHGYFLSGGHVNLTLPVSDMITKDDISSGRAFDVKWLLSKGHPKSFRNSKLFRSPLYAKLLNTITPTKATWDGCSASGWRTDLLAVNGFNEKMVYGGEDREFGERLMNMGIRPVQLRYSAVTIHLYHDRPYKTEEGIRANIQIRKETRKNRIVKTPFGIEKL